jgi:membrane protease YdiL (CAAX protease family)
MSPTSECCLVLGIALGLPIASALDQAVRGTALTPLSNGAVAGLCTYELVALLLIAYILRSRGWSRSDLTIAPSPGGTLWGILLLVVSVLAYWAAAVLVRLLTGSFAFAEGARVDVSASLPWIVMLSLINPVFEESMTVAYLMRYLRERGPVVAVGASSLLRVLYHLYQGPVALVGVLPLAVVFAAFYWSRRQLWPLLVAHALGDFIGVALARVPTQ